MRLTTGPFLLISTFATYVILCDADANRIIQTTTTTAFSAFSRRTFIDTMEAEVRSLELDVRILLVCPRSVCQPNGNLPCPNMARTYENFVNSGCDMQPSSGRHSELLQTTSGTYVEFALQDRDGTIPNLDNRVSSGYDRLQRFIATSNIADGIRMTRDGPVVPISTNNDDDNGFDNDNDNDSDREIYEEWWFWLIIALAILCCLLLLIYLCMKQRKKKKGKQGKDKYREEGYYGDGRYRSKEEQRKSEEEMAARQRAAQKAKFKPGERVEGFYQGEWYPATVQGGNNVYGYDLFWDDGTRTESMPEYHVRHGPEETEWKSQRLAIGEPVIARSGGRYHSGWVHEIHGEDDTVTIEKHDGSLRRVPENQVDIDPEG